MKRITGHRLDISTSGNYVTGECKCGQWSKFINSGRRMKKQDTDFIKREYADHKDHAHTSEAANKTAPLHNFG